LPGHLAGLMRALGPLAGHFRPPSGLLLQAIVVGAIVAILLLLTGIPVIFDLLMEVGSKQARRAAPRTFIAGGVILLIGLVLRITVIDLVGGGLMAIVVLAAIMDNY
jgi:hypothetical protein